MSGSPLVSDRFRTVALATALCLAAAACATEPTGPDDPDPPSNQTPVAQATAPPTVSATLPVTVDGSGSTDADGDALTYSWSFAATPVGSQAAFADETAVSTSFTPDLPGTYTANLVVSDGEASSTAASATITAEDNTATMTIGAAGGSIESSDGVVTLEVPAAALTEDTEISITLVPEFQRPDELADLPSDAVVYDFQPDGLSFGTPATLSFASASPPPPAGSEEFQVEARMIGGLTNGDLFVPGGQSMTVDAGTGAQFVSAEIEHFTTFASQPLVVDDGQSGLWLSVGRLLPPEIVISVPFDIVAQVSGSSPEADAGFFANPPISFGDQSGEGLVVTQPLQTDFAGEPGSFFAHVTNQYTCLEPTVTWRGRYDLDLISVGVLHAAESFSFGVMSVFLESSIECDPLPEEWLSISAERPEGLGYVGASRGPDPDIVLALEGGMWLSESNGDVRARFNAPSGQEFTQFFDAGAAAGIGIYGATPTGLFVAPVEPAEAEGDYELSMLLSYAPPRAGQRSGPMPAEPDVTAHVTDVFAAPDGEGGEQIVAVLFGDQNLAFFEARDAGLGGRGRTDLAEAFKDDQGSVFGTELPVTAWVGPNGFTESDPMLVVTVTDDADRASTLWRADLVAGRAVLTEVTNIFPAAEARRLRCLNGICALSSYGSAFGFGNVVFFSWDGQDGITPIQGLSQRTIGVDLIESGAGSVFIATTSFNSDAYTVFEIAEDGEFLDSWFNPVPDGCTGPGHVLFRSPSEVLLSCNTSGNVVSSRPFDGE